MLLILPRIISDLALYKIKYIIITIAGFDFHGSVCVQDSLFHLRTPYMSLGRSPCESLLLKDNKSSVKVADFNDP